MLKCDTAVILNIDPEGNVFGNDELYEKTKLIPLDLLHTNSRAVVSEEVKTRALALGYKADKMRQIQNAAYIEEKSLFSVPAAFIDGVINELQLPQPDENQWNEIAANLPQGRIKSVKLDNKLTIINDGSSKGLLPVKNIINYLKTIPNAVLLTSRKEVTDDDVEIYYCDTGVKDMEDSIKAILDTQPDGHMTIAYSPGTSIFGKGFSSINDRIDKFNHFIRKHRK
jgi:hypothetical protein